MEAAIKAGLVLEQRKLKMQNIESGMKWEDDIGALKLLKRERKSSRTVDCNTSTFPTHTDSNCPAEDEE